MSSNNNKKKLAWKSDSIEGALLFLLFYKEIFNPDNFSAAEIEQDPLYGFEKFLATTFKRSAQTIANRVKKFEEKNGAGLTAAFKGHLKDVLDKYSEVLKTEEEDGDYQDKGEDNISHISKAEDEASLSDPLQDSRFTSNTEHPPIDTANILPTSTSCCSQEKQATKEEQSIKEKSD